MQSAPSPRFDFRTRLDQGLHKSQVAPQARYQQSRIPVPVAPGKVGLAGYQQRCQITVAAARSKHEQRIPVAITGVHVQAAIEQRRNLGIPAALHGLHDFVERLGECL
jgi:hypothetical protein